MRRPMPWGLFAVLLLTSSSVADQNNAVALQFCDWIEANVAALNDALPDDSPLNQDWRDGRKLLNAISDYRESTAVSTWSSVTGKHSIEARFVERDSASVELEGQDGKTVRVEIDRLDNKSSARLSKIKRLQQELILNAYSLYNFMIAPDDPSDPRWKFLDPLPVQLPERMLEKPDLASLPARRWETSQGKPFVGTIRSKTRVSGDSATYYVFGVEDGGEKRISHIELTELSRNLAEQQLRQKLASTADMKRYDKWLARLEEVRKELNKNKKDAAWKISKEFGLSREALAETRRWIESQQLRNRGKYELAFTLLQRIGRLYREKDTDKLKDFLNNPQLEAALLIARKEFQTQSWKGDVEDLLLYSSAGKIYVRDADGEGKHLTLAEVWKKSAIAHHFRTVAGE